ncbi:hypothetical protein [Streptomyces sp. NPDC002328]|uniref:hypothetical protein n=1 Tax=Streptomyces sp. NPDC002328 TaxID=3364642 RepID=UPI0036CD138D
MTVTRRSVLFASTAAPVAGAVLATPACHAAGHAESASGPTGRRTLALRDGWRFAQVNPGGITDPTGRYADAAGPGHDDSGWRRVAVPAGWAHADGVTESVLAVKWQNLLPGSRWCSDSGAYRETAWSSPGLVPKAAAFHAG